jgi:cyanophycin synthetase
VTSKLLTEASLPTPGFVSFYRKSFNKEEALKQLSKLNYPIIVKHAMGSNSSGLFVNILTPKQAVKILRKELKNFRSMIAQEMVYGKEYRVLVLGNKVIAAMEMIHPYVLGDGVSKLRTLIKTKQDDADRRTKFDKQFKQFVKKQGFSLRDVVPKGKTVFIKQSCSLAEGGETKDVTDTVHKDVVDICVKASKIVGKNLVGIDIICKDISKKQTKKSLNILEVNGKPDFYIHYKPNHGRPRNVLKDILKFMVK